MQVILRCEVYIEQYYADPSASSSSIKGKLDWLVQRVTTLHSSADATAMAAPFELHRVPAMPERIAMCPLLPPLTAASHCCCLSLLFPLTISLLPLATASSHCCCLTTAALHCCLALLPPLTAAASHCCCLSLLFPLTAVPSHHLTASSRCCLLSLLLPLTAAARRIKHITPRKALKENSNTASHLQSWH